MPVDKQNELMSDLLFTFHQHGGDDVTWKPPIERLERLTITFTSNGKRKFVPRDQVSPITCRLFLHINQ